MPTMHHLAGVLMVGTLSLCPPHEPGCELICFALKRNFVPSRATNWHDGQITSDFPKSCQARESKIFHFRSHPNQSHNFARLTADEGRSRRHERAVRCGGR